MMFTERPLPERFPAALAAGFDTVEMLFPYEANLADLRAALDATGQSMALINTPRTDWNGAAMGLAAIDGAQELFRRDLDRAVTAAGTLGATFIHVMAGNSSGAKAHDTFLENLDRAARNYPDQQFSIEPLSPINAPGYFLNDFDQAAGILDDLGAANVGFQFDAFHGAMIHGDVLDLWDHHGHRAVHVQIAGPPDRAEPQHSDLPLEEFLQRLDRDGYDGVVSGEYHPAGRTEDGLGWTDFPSRTGS